MNNDFDAFTLLLYTSRNIYLICFSVAGHSEPQHSGHRHHSCAFSARQSRLLLHQKPGKGWHQYFNTLWALDLTLMSYFCPLCVLIHLCSQGRQKLARFSAHEFATLVIDILTDAKRRQWGNSCDSPKGTIM